MAVSFTPGTVHAPATDIFAGHSPPFDLAADMLFAAALAPSGPLRRTFPRTPFLSVLGCTPLVMWFSRVTGGCYYTAQGERRCEPIVYHELNVLALLRDKALFVPGIYVTSEESLRLGHRYGMPKRLAAMSFSTEPGRIHTVTVDRSRCSRAGARLLGAGRLFARLLAPLWPVRVWPVRFPSGAAVRALLRGAERATPVLLSGRLALAEPWLPRALPLLPLGAYFAGLTMRLPPP